MVDTLQQLPGEHPVSLLLVEARIVAIGDAARRLGSTERLAPAGPVGHPGIPESILPSRSQT